jgi:hypothetical protein
MHKTVPWTRGDLIARHQGWEPQRMKRSSLLCGSLGLAAMTVVISCSCQAGEAAPTPDGDAAVAIPDATEDLAAEVVDPTPEVTVEVAAEVTPDVGAEVTPDVAPEVAADAEVEPDNACLGAYGDPEAIFQLPGDSLVEISGLVASRTYPGVFWGHNDSGDEPRILAFNETGVLMDLRVQDVEAVDWEELSRGPCPLSNGDGDCLWVADIGNNLKNREVLTIIVVAEPEPAGALIEHRPAEAIYTFRYPDDTMDAEAFVVALDGSRFYVIEKAAGDVARVFSSPTPLDGSETMTLVEVTTMTSPGEPVPYGKMMTAADLHPSGSRIVLRCYTGTWEYRFEPGQGFEHLGEIAPTYVALGPLEELQGEAVAYGADGLDLFTVSEDPGFVGNQPFHRYACQD